MAKTLLRSGSLDDFLALGENGQAVFDSALQIRETLRLRKQSALADCLAIPQPNDEGCRVDWYAPLDGSVLGWAAASDEQRKTALRCLESCQANIATLIQRCQQAEKTAIQLFGSLLSSALQFPGSQHVYLVDGKPVITFWGFVNLNQTARDDALDCLRVAQTDEPAIDFIPEPVLPNPTPARLSTADEPLVYTMPTQVASAPVLTHEAPAAAPKTKSILRHRMLPIAAVALILIAAPVTYNSLSAPVAKPVAAVTAAPAPVAPAAIKTDRPVAQSTLPLVQATVVAAAIAKQEAVPAPVSAAKNALLFPAEALRMGSTTFLNGAWRVTIDASNPVTGRPPVLRYQIADNKGTARLIHGDNVSCKVAVFSGLHSNGVLMIKTRGSARCSDGSRYPMPEISCKPGDNGVAHCTGRYAGDTVVPLTFKKVSD